MSVVLFHYNGRLELTSLGGSLVEHGNLGVALFFVLSGFVITLSLGDKLMSPSYLARFAARRSLRLDPPYLCTIGAMILIAYFGAAYGAHAFVPDAPTLIAHVFYLQDLLHLPAILPIFWSLCLEIQFYLVIALMLWALQRGTLPSRRVGNLHYQLVFLAGIAASIACRHYSVLPATFAGFWFCFAVGASTYWASVGWIDRRYAYAAILLVVGYGLLFQDPWAVTAALSASVILIAAIANKLDLLSSRVPQFMGRISYSLYLTHLIFGWYALSIAMRYVSKPLAFAIGMVVCIVSAWAWYWVIERPSVLLSKRLTDRRKTPVGPVVVQSAPSNSN